MKDPISFVEPKWQTKHERQRVNRGFSNFDAWNGDEYLAFVIGGMAKWHRKNGHGYPSLLTEKKWHKILRKIERGMQATLDLNDVNAYDGNDYSTWATQQRVIADKGWDLFHEWRAAFWD